MNERRPCNVVFANSAKQSVMRETPLEFPRYEKRANVLNSLGLVEVKRFFFRLLHYEGIRESSADTHDVRWTLYQRIILFINVSISVGNNHHNKQLY